MVLVLVLTGQSMALARSLPGPAGSVVLCTGAGPVTVLVDESGAPVEPAHICPECTAAYLSGALPDAPDLPRHLQLATAVQPAWTKTALPDNPCLAMVRARAPPLRV